MRMNLCTLEQTLTIVVFFQLGRCTTVRSITAAWCVMALGRGEVDVIIKSGSSRYELYLQRSQFCRLTKDGRAGGGRGEKTECG